MTRPIDLGGRLARARLGAASIVGGLVAVGMVATIASPGSSVSRELSLAVLSGGIVGGALVAVESLLSHAAAQRAEFSALMAQLSTTINLSGIDLRGRDLRDLYLPGRALVAAQLGGVRLDGAKLYFGDLRHANLSGASLRGVDFSGSTLAYADLSGADLRMAVLLDVDLSDAVLTGADLSGAVLTGARVCGASLIRTRLDGATVRNSYLQGATLTEASLKATILELNEYDEVTSWPSGFDPPASAEVTQPAIAQMDLAEYLAWRAHQPEGRT